MFREHHVRCKHDHDGDKMGTRKKTPSGNTGTTRAHRFGSGRPTSSHTGSHGTDATNGEPRWVSALATKNNSDTVVSGSRDGYIGIWAVGEGFRSLKQVGQVSLSGFVNCLSISACGGWLVAGVGQEHRLGRWWRDSSVKNRLHTVAIPDEETE